MNGMNNGDFPSGYPEFEIPITPGQAINNLFDATLAGVFGDEKNISSDYVKNFLGSSETEVMRGDDCNFYMFSNFQVTEHVKKYVLGIDFQCHAHKNKKYIKVGISPHFQTNDLMFKNFIKSSNLKWVETDYPMTIEAMAIRHRTTNPYGYRRFDASFEQNGCLCTMGIITNENAFISDVIIVLENI